MFHLRISVTSHLELWMLSPRVLVCVEQAVVSPHFAHGIELGQDSKACQNTHLKYMGTFITLGTCLPAGCKN